MRAQTAFSLTLTTTHTTFVNSCIQSGSFLCRKRSAPVVSSKTETQRNSNSDSRRSAGETIPSRNNGSTAERKCSPYRTRKLRASVDPSRSPSVIPKPAPITLSEGSHAVVWLRNDLRIHDHAAFALANTADIVSPIYVFDTSQYGPDHLSPHRFQRTGPFRAVFQVETIQDLRNELRKRGSDLILRQGDPASELTSVIRELANANLGDIHVVAHKEVTWEEVQHEKRLERDLAQLEAEMGIRISLHFVWDNTLHHLNDLPFDAGGPGVPPTFTAYRRIMEAEGGSVVRQELEMPERFKPFPLHLVMGRNATIISDPLPSLRVDLEVDGLCDPHEYAFPDPRACIDFKGGPTAAEERLDEFVWSSEAVSTYKESRNEFGTRDGSSKLSPWLALGCVSPRSIYWTVKKYEEKRTANESTKYMIHELMTRDYFRWVAASVGSKLFALNGYSGPRAGEKSIWDIDRSTITEFHAERLQKWIQGQTGAPFVDASMRELAATGFISNKGRQNVASFLINDLEFPDWRAGAEYFESVLIDHDVASNWGNWAYLAGVGSDPRSRRRFNVIKQGMEYDPEGWFLTRWCPELLEIPPPMIHEPYTLSAPELDDMDVILGETYPVPIIPLPTALVQEPQTEKPDSVLESTTPP